MKMSMHHDWSILNGLIKSTISRKAGIDEHMENEPNSEKTGDHFYDYIGKFCNQEAAKKL